MRPFAQLRFWGRRATWVGLYVAGSLVVFLIFLKDPGINGFERAQTLDLIAGRAWKPYVSRMLLPWLTERILAAFPSSVWGALDELVRGSPLARRSFAAFGFSLERPSSFLVIGALMYGALVGWLAAFGALCRSVYRASSAARNCVGLAALLGLPAMFGYCNYVYDLANLMFITLGLWLLHERKWAPYLLVYAVALFNKETTVVLALVFAIHFRPSSDAARGAGLGRGKYAALLLSQLLLAAVIRYALARRFADAPGDHFTLFGLAHNPGLLRSYPPSTFLTALAVVGAVLGHWREKPRLLRDALWLLVPLVGACLFFGFLDERRAYYEGYPVVVLLAAPTIARLLGGRLESRGPEVEGA